MDNLQLVDAHTSPGAYWPHRIWTREQTKLSPGLFEPGEGSALFKVERLQKPYVFNDGKESLAAFRESPGVRGPSSEPPLKQRRLAECTRDWVRLESRSNPGCYFYHNAKEGKTLKEPPECSGWIKKESIRTPGCFYNLHIETCTLRLMRPRSISQCYDISHTLRAVH